jgi:adenosylcobinamide-GDP ribazoletransferase
MLAKWLSDLVNAFTFLTILPVRRFNPASDPRFNRAPGAVFSYFPLVGLVIGVVVFTMMSLRFLPAGLTSFVALVVWVGLTGGLHLDGLADSCDGLLATVTPERRLEIMKDPRAGSWAVVGVVLLLLGKWIALQSAPPLLLILPPMAGRWAMTIAAASFPGARTSGLGSYFHEGLGRIQVILATITVLIVGVWLGTRSLITLLVALLATLALGRWAARRLGGGLTGDVYGAVCELVELLCLILLNIH